MRTSSNRVPKVISGLFLATICSLVVSPMPFAVAQTASDVVLHPPELEKLMPTTVFFRGQTATVQVAKFGWG